MSNVDQALIIFAAKNPKPNYNLLDRFLMMMEKQDVPVIVCFNKVDLAKEKETEIIRENLRKLWTYRSFTALRKKKELTRSGN